MMSFICALLTWRIHGYFLLFMTCCGIDELQKQVNRLREEALIKAEIHASIVAEQQQPVQNLEHSMSSFSQLEDEHEHYNELKAHEHTIGLQLIY